MRGVLCGGLTLTFTLFYTNSSPQLRAHDHRIRRLRRPLFPSAAGRRLQVPDQDPGRLHPRTREERQVPRTEEGGKASRRRRRQASQRRRLQLRRQRGDLERGHLSRGERGPRETPQRRGHGPRALLLRDRPLQREPHGAARGGHGLPCG